MPAQKPLQVRAAANFLQNLDAAGEFLLALDAGSAPHRFEQIKRQIDELITLLEANPGIGRPARFNTTRSIQSRAANAAVQRLAESMHVKSLTEYVLKDHVLLYAELEAEVVLLAFKHQRQLHYQF